MGAALRSLQSESRDEPLQAAEAVLRGIRDASMSSAARDVAANAGATPAARAMALRSLLAQHSTALVVVQLAASPDATPPCRTITVAGDLPSAGAALPADSARQALVVARAVGGEIAAPTSLRTLARCAQLTFSSVASLPVSASSIELTYLCGNQFRVRNLDDEWVDLTCDVDGTDDSGDLTVPPHGEIVVTTDTTGMTRIFVNPDHTQERGTLVQTRANGGAPCVPDAPEPRLWTASGTATVKVGTALVFNTAVIDGAGDGPWRYTLDRGDGTSFTANLTSLPSPERPLPRQKSWTVPGTVTVRLSVTDKYGKTGQTSMSVTISP